MEERHEYQSISVESAGAVGAYVRGVDLADFDANALADLRAAFAEYGLLFFPDQTLTPAQHIAFAEAWGEINVNRFFAAVPEYPQIAEVLKEPDQSFNVGGGWHTDHSYDEIPALGSMLYAKELPLRGGDTLFANTCLAYDTLSDGLKETLHGLSALHSSRHAFGPGAAYGEAFKGRLSNAEAATQDVVHPVVITHPLSGRKSLYVNPGFTRHFVGWTMEESEALLQYLYRHVARPEHTIRLKWSPGMLAFWDNRATWHMAVNDYHGQRRYMHRITLEGVPVAA